MHEAYRSQVDLLLDILPLVGQEEGLALKGGTAINLFVRDMPRLSVDIDLTWLNAGERADDLQGIAAALDRIRAKVEATYPDTRCRPSGSASAPEVKLLCERQGTQIKIEVNAVLRGHLQPPRMMVCSDRVQDEFGKFVEVPVIAHGELFGGKICAALDRQHPRDLFDVRGLLDMEGFSDDVRLGFIAALVSHNRPIAELLKPNRLDQRETFAKQFAGMAFEEFTYDDHEATMDRLIGAVHRGLTPDDRSFLRSFDACEPDWSFYPLAGLADLPGPRWKLQNLRKLQDQNPSGWAANLEALEDALGGE